VEQRRDLMNWLTPVETSGLFTTKDGHDFNFPRIKKLNLDEVMQQGVFDTTTEFFLSLTASISEPNQLNIPIPNNDTLNMLVERLGKHYTSVKVALLNSNPVTLTLVELIRNSEELLKEMVASNEIHPIVKDLYHTSNKAVTPHEVTNKLVYKIEATKIEHCNDESFEPTWILLEVSYQCEGDLLLVPRKWYLTDDLRHSIALRYFSGKVKTAYLWVNSDTQEVLYLHIKFD